MILYPIKFQPILKEKIWGGHKLNTILNKGKHQGNIGESWELSDVEGNISQVQNGPYQGSNLKALLQNHKEQLLGAQNFEIYGTNFPLLIKFLDAHTDLSVQVHPDNDMAAAYHNSFGKTEMWYIMDSDADANIILGLKDETTNTEILDHIDINNVDHVFNRTKVNRGDSYFIPAGKIHAIGAGVLAAEIQQTSDITYRVYDWDRVDDMGCKRELHTELAKKATKHFDLDDNYKLQYNSDTKSSSNLVKCEYFTTNLLHSNSSQTLDYSQLDSFVILMCVEGSVQITLNEYTESIKMGETLLIPAAANHIILNSQNAKLLEVYID
ncbi:type I phosphomannose isomerase catalytic subunit [uncultured Psychroserpens sp.]|uniref:type I phosphomannose isomerase catalytic subunit n=1 Tax=uncultured Psychroserpens sp. TaxID=255436 RepID=UPI0026098F8B|nr:type I phosphomannose isomerase catalytic subunit [uncultured Psychroserpens sp.]